MQAIKAIHKEGNIHLLTVLPYQGKTASGLNDDDQFMLEAYSAVIESDPEEDAVWGKICQKLILFNQEQYTFITRHINLLRWVPFLSLAYSSGTN